VRLVILGGSGSGKSTQAQRLGRYFDIPQISTGEILREAISSDQPLPEFRLSEADPRTSLSVYASLSELGYHARPYMQKGELVPDEMIINLIRIRLRHCLPS
jgi:adenylate kinase